MLKEHEDNIEVGDDVEEKEGGGAILRSKGSVTGTATAVSIWNVGAIGTAVAWQRYEIALLLSLLNFITLSVGSIIKKKFENTK